MSVFGCGSVGGKWIWVGDLKLNQGLERQGGVMSV